MSEIVSKLKSIPILKNIIHFLQIIKIPGLNGLSLYDLIEMYVLGIINGALTARAGSISFSFFMALFPFLLFILNLIPFIPIDNLDVIVFDFIEILLPKETHDFFSDIFLDIQSKPRRGLLSSVFLLSIFLTANGVNSIFVSFEESYHVESTRNFFKQYLFSIGVSILLALLLLFAVCCLWYVVCNPYVCGMLFVLAERPCRGLQKAWIVGTCEIVFCNGHQELFCSPQV